MIAGRTLTTTQVAIIALSLLAILFAILAAFGVFNGSKSRGTAGDDADAPDPHRDRDHDADEHDPRGGGAVADPQAGDQGAQVKTLQKALTSLGYSPGTPDGDYGPSTQNAVERFQIAKGLGEDGIVGPATLNALQKALQG